MRHTDEEIEQAAGRLDQLLDKTDPATANVGSTDDLREIAAASDAARADEARLLAAVNSARVGGRSWNQIAIALGVSRQAARQRFASKLPA